MSNPNEPSNKAHNYTNGEITVIWQPHLCKHSTFCWRQLRTVFDPGKRPWIDMQGAPSDAIIEQVKKCPSGALSYTMNEETVKLEAENG